MKKILLILVVISFSVLQAHNTGFGLGLILGAPSGLDARIYLNKKNSLNFIAAWDLGVNRYKDKDGNLYTADMLHLSFDFDFQYYHIKVKKGAMPWYWGLGGRIVIGNDRFRIGPRVPAGLIYQFAGAPVELFTE
ncbi:MAG TPA: hypothetical protein VKS21_11680, partial [Spirochaetota bacterium]|nr:hypothetical protein [Spirochaetota bacterium]